MDNNEINNNVNEDTGIFPNLDVNVTSTTPNEQLDNSVNNQIFNDDLNDLDYVSNQTYVNDVSSSLDINSSSESVQSSSISVNEEIKPQINTPVNSNVTEEVKEEQKQKKSKGTVVIIILLLLIILGLAGYIVYDKFYNF